jgi:small subunit ribosomal protein S15
MSLTHDQKEELFKKFGSHKTDTGSANVQVALISERIQMLTEHFKTHRKDFGSRRGLLMLIGRRRRLLKYLRKHQEDVYLKLIKALNLKHVN